MAAVGSQEPDMVELEAHAASREKVDAATPQAAAQLGGWHLFLDRWQRCRRKHGHLLLDLFWNFILDAYVFVLLTQACFKFWGFRMLFLQ